MSTGPRMRYLYVLCDRGGAWATIRAHPMPPGAGLGVTFLGRCDEDSLAWDLFWAAHRLMTDGWPELPEDGAGLHPPDWVTQAGIDGGGGGTGALTTAERAELVALRREARQLRMEREIPKKAAAFFAKENH
jgi:transposase